MNDPWSKREAWRFQYPFKTMKISKMFPGLGLGVGAFIVYCLSEKTKITLCLKKHESRIALYVFPLIHNQNRLRSLSSLGLLSNTISPESLS
ncbi:hypothetical protein PORY_001551 [Pneumocystis oryctolagi]|uniref:Uncharacterized protein n=1 Tax=Pneumocystis oryctolagi TaxID=42067 RepID=A0ACB7CAV6_9ASCO|nr:hypothetical protein PORY_001551 [Pneumocystis oryctolagi]